MEISAVIATCNRKTSLFRLLRSLDRQIYPVKEVVIIDSSDTSIADHTLAESFPGLSIKYTPSVRSVSAQRNLGIRTASAEYILLCDDDLEFPPDYLKRVSDFIRLHPEAGVVSGLLLEPGKDGRFASSFPETTFGRLLWDFLFQRTVWADVSKVKTNLLGFPFLFLLKRYYRKRGNTWSLAGWPLVTQIMFPFFRTSFFSLGGAVTRRDWLLASPFDELLDAYGIGDNYGVALNMPGRNPVFVYQETHVFHHKSNENRIPHSLGYFRRILALHYFLSRDSRYSSATRFFLIWSLIGNWIYQSIKRQSQMRKATSKAIHVILTGRNPYLAAMQEENAIDGI